METQTDRPRLARPSASGGLLGDSDWRRVAHGLESRRPHHDERVMCGHALRERHRRHRQRRRCCPTDSAMRSAVFRALSF